MKELTKVNENIYRLITPYKDIWTTVYFIKTEEGVMIFDTASSAEDTEQYILPALEEIGGKPNDVKYVFISHKHRDHAGGLEKLMEYIPNARIFSRSDKLKEEYGDKVYYQNDGEYLMSCIKAVTIPGHTADSCAVLDTRTKTLITGDCMQVYGIFGSGDWGCNISYIPEHFEALDKVALMDIDEIYTAHDYYPIGYRFIGKAEISAAIDGCKKPLLEIKALIENDSDKDDSEIRCMYNDSAEVPRVSVVVVAAVRKAAEEGRI